MTASMRRRAGWAGLTLAVLVGVHRGPAGAGAQPGAVARARRAARSCSARSRSRVDRRLGWGTVVLGVLAAVGAVAATNSGQSNLRDVFTWSALVASMLRFATPLLFAALGGIVSERSGVINIGLEGMMLMGAFFGIYGSDALGSWVLGLVVAVLAGGALALAHAVFSIHLRADQVVSGTAVNFLALGITGYVFIDHYGDNGTPDNISRAPDVALPRHQAPRVLRRRDRPREPADVDGAAARSRADASYLFRTRGGLRLRAVGEKPRAAETVGVSVIAHALRRGDRVRDARGAGRRVPVGRLRRARSTRT